MSFDIYVMAFKDGEPTKFDRTIVDRAFGRQQSDHDGFGFGVAIPGEQQTAAFVFIDDDPEVDGFSVNRPPYAPAFWNALFDVLRQTPTVLVWPSEEANALVANDDALAAMPSNMIDMLCDPPVVKSGAEIMTSIGIVDVANRRPRYKPNRGRRKVPRRNPLLQAVRDPSECSKSTALASAGAALFRPLNRLRPRGLSPC